jgi:rRNA maturation RNase YbeY
MISIITSSRYKINRQKIKLLIENVFEKEQLSSQFGLNIIFVGKNKMKNITKKYKGENETLPVLSFPYNEKVGEEKILLGEVILCYPLVILLAAERNKRVDDVINELIKHGVENLLK